MTSGNIRRMMGQNSPTHIRHYIPYFEWEVGQDIHKKYTRTHTRTLMYVYPTGDSVPTYRKPGTLANLGQSPIGGVYSNKFPHM